MNRLNGMLRRVPVWSLYIGGALPGLWLVLKLFTGGLGVDPVKAFEHGLGLHGLQFLLAGLCVTPLLRTARLNLMRFRRALGLIAFFYIVLHLGVWLLLDMQLQWPQILRDLVRRPYITLGMASFLLLIPLAITSNAAAIRRLGGRAWQRLHLLTYPALALGALHYLILARTWSPELAFHFFAALILLAIRVPMHLRRGIRGK